jgi:hypothetical protein
MPKLTHTTEQLVSMVRNAKVLKAQADAAEAEAKAAIYAANQQTGADAWESDDGKVKLSAVAGREGFDRARAQSFLTAEQYRACITHGEPTLQVRFTMPVTPAAKVASKAA